MRGSNNSADTWTAWKVVLYALFIVSLLLGAGRVARAGELMEGGAHLTRPVPASLTKS